MRSPYIFALPPSCSAVYACVTTDIHILDQLTLTSTGKRHDIKISELCSDVISVVKVFGWEVTRDPPMSGLGLNRFHVVKGHFVHVAVWGLLVDWRVYP